VWSMPRQCSRVVQVVDVDRIPDDVVPEVVGGAVGDPGPDAPAGQPNGEAAGMMVAAGKRLSVQVILLKAQEHLHQEQRCCPGIEQAAALRRRQHFCPGFIRRQHHVESTGQDVSVDSSLFTLSESGKTPESRR
jgi:hypothetical protein